MAAEAGSSFGFTVIIYSCSCSCNHYSLWKCRYQRCKLRLCQCHV